MINYTGKFATLIGQLLTPFRYFNFISAGKLQIDFLFPAIAAGVVVCIFYSVSGGVALLGADGLVGSVNNLLQILTGFFVAGLAAIFGSPAPALDQAPAGFRFLGSLRNSSGVTRRMLLCALFGYLAFSSFSLYLLGAIVNLCAPVFSGLSDSMGWKYLLVYLYLFWMWNIFFVTVYGLYYMIDRAHRSDPIVVSGPTDGASGGN